MGTLIDRSTLLVMLVKMQDSTAEAALKAYSAAFAPLDPELLKTLTYDQGKEMALHSKLAKTTGIKVYFCDLYRPLATQYLRENQWVAAPVSAQRSRPVDVLAARA